jgi:hypothetical protein
MRSWMWGWFVGLSWSGAALAAPTLDISGTCGGEVTAEVTLDAPGTYRLLWGEERSYTITGGGLCSGVEMAVGGSASGELPASSGSASMSFTVSPEHCGLSVQAIDLETCEVSGVAVLPLHPRDTCVEGELYDPAAVACVSRSSIMAEDGSYDDGYIDGYLVGFIDASDVYSTDYADGFEAGFATGEAACSDDYATGFADGFASVACEDCEVCDLMAGYDEGLSVGYEEGFVAGEASVEVEVCEDEPVVAGSICADHSQWTAVTCTTDSWLWSSDRSFTTIDAAEAARTLYSGCFHAGDNDEGMCSLDGTGWVSTESWTMSGCDSTWYHLAPSWEGDCGGHDGDVVRYISTSDDGCFDY